MKPLIAPVAITPDPSHSEGRSHQFPSSLNTPVLPTVGPLGFQIKGEIKKTSKKEQLQEEEKVRLTSLEESKKEVRHLELKVQRQRRAGVS